MTDWTAMAEQLAYCLLSMATVVLVFSPAVIYALLTFEEGDDE